MAEGIFVRSSAMEPRSDQTTRNNLLMYMRDVLGVQHIITSHAPPKTPAENLAPDASENISWMKIIAPESCLFSFCLVSSETTMPDQWSDILSTTERAQLGKVIEAMGFRESDVGFVITHKNWSPSQLTKDESKRLKNSGLLLLFGEESQRVWFSAPVEQTGQILDRHGLLFFPTLGLTEMTADPSVKKQIWADLKVFIARIGKPR